jgi:hypothetical protein
MSLNRETKNLSTLEETSKKGEEGGIEKKTTTKTTEPKKIPLDALEEDDEFEEFSADGK